MKLTYEQYHALEAWLAAATNLAVARCLSDAFGGTEHVERQMYKARKEAIKALVEGDDE